MSVDMIEFEMSLATEDHLKVITEVQKIDDSSAAMRCIIMGHFVMTKMKEKLRFYQEDELMEVPQPQKLRPEINFAKMRLLLTSSNQQRLSEIRQAYDLDIHSALAWGLACLERFEETIMTHRIYLRGQGAKTIVRLDWIYD